MVSNQHIRRKKRKKKILDVKLLTTNRTTVPYVVVLLPTKMMHSGPMGVPYLKPEFQLCDTHWKMYITTVSW
jgi:hypothetical protein